MIFGDYAGTAIKSYLMSKIVFILLLVIIGFLIFSGIIYSKLIAARQDCELIKSELSKCNNDIENVIGSIQYEESQNAETQEYIRHLQRTLLSLIDEYSKRMQLDKTEDNSSTDREDRQDSNRGIREKGDNSERVRETSKSKKEDLERSRLRVFGK